MKFYPHSQPELKTIHYHKIIDLSHKISPQIPRWSGDPPIQFTPVADYQNHGYYLRQFSLGEHSGTHINAPNTFDQNGISIDQYQPESLVCPAIVIDFTQQSADHADAVLTKDHIQEWERENQPIPPQSIVLLYTGWQNKWFDSQAFFNPDSQGKYHFPGFDLNAIQFLLEQRKIKGVGIDTHGIDPGQEQSFSANQFLLKNAGIVLENLNNLDQLPPQGIYLVIGILKLQGGSGSPVSVLAFTL